MLNQIEVRGAKPIGDQKIDEVSIHISGCFPEITTEDLDHLAQGFENDAYKIFQGLRSLPGGTFDKLLILMLQKTATSFIVPHDFHDAPLRAAAPDLLKACEDFLDYAPSIGNRCLYCNASVYGSEDTDEHSPDCEIEKGRKAIVKARGESEAQDG